MLRALFLLSLAFCSLTANSQNRPIPVTLHSRVDTFDQNVKEIAALYEAYLNSRPDSIYDNPHWNRAEKDLYPDFDFTRLSLFPMPAPQLLQYYRPTILTIVPYGELYSIRTLFAADNLDGAYRNGNPWCITRIFATKEKGEWKLKNALPVLTEKWERKQFGKITFIYPPTHSFNADLAQQSAAFCEETVDKFQLPPWDPFEFYITDDMDEMGTLEGFDFYYPGSTVGKVLLDKRIVLTSHGSEWYPHELVHIIAPKGDRHRFINEGFATMVGGANKCNTLWDCVERLAIDLKNEPDTTLNDIFTEQWRKEYSPFYILGGLLCQYAYSMKGVGGLHSLLNIPQNDAQLHANLAQLFGISDAAWGVFIHKPIGPYLT